MLKSLHGPKSCTTQNPNNKIFIYTTILLYNMYINARATYFSNVHIFTKWPTLVLSFLPHFIFLLGPLALMVADLHKVMLGVSSNTTCCEDGLLYLRDYLPWKCHATAQKSPTFKCWWCSFKKLCTELRMWYWNSIPEVL